MSNAGGHGGPRGWIVCGLITSLVVAVAANAVGESLKTKSKTVSIPASGTEAATAKCKKGLKAVSGGFEGSSDDTQAISARIKGARKFEAAAYNDDMAAASSLTAYVYCREGERVAKKESSEPIEGSVDTILPYATDKELCKPGDKVVSGGFDSSEPRFIFPYESRRDGGRGWRVSMFSLNDEPGTVTAFAFCADEARLKTRSTIVDTPPYPATRSAEATCKRKERAISGGFEQTDPGPDFTSDAQIWALDSKRQGRRNWTYTGFNFGDAPGEIAVYAYCEKK